MNQSTDASGAFTFAELRARTVGMSGPQRAATFYALPDEVEAEAYHELAEQVARDRELAGEE
jgi:hypothetical protein